MYCSLHVPHEVHYDPEHIPGPPFLVQQLLLCVLSLLYSPLLLQDNDRDPTELQPLYRDSIRIRLNSHIAQPR